MRKNARIFAIIAALILTPYALADESIKNEALIKQCDLNGDGQIYGRKDAKAHNIPMDVAKKEYKCKRAIESAEVTRRNEEATRRLAEVKAESEKLDRKLAEVTARYEDSKRRLEESTEEYNKSIEDLNKEMSALAEAIEKNEQQKD